jgi:methionyl-tRNA formyltransferase
LELDLFAMTSPARIALATPHPRYDALERALHAIHGIEVLRVRTPSELNLAALERFAPTHVFFPHWSSKIPSDIFERFESIIFHMTDVPFGRGGSPLQNLVTRGIETTRLSALRCVAELDAGPVYLKRDLSTLGTAEEVFLRAARLMESMIVDIVAQCIKPTPQSGEVTPFRRRVPADGDLLPAARLDIAYDMIRMLDGDGYPPAYLEVGNLRYEFTRASHRRGYLIADVRIMPINAKESS